MTQSLTQGFSQQMRMEQRLTPQLIQSMSILQKPVAELEAYINDALETNAALEIAERQSDDSSTDPGHSDQNGHRLDFDAGFARLSSFNRANGLDFDDQRPSFARRAGGDEPDAKMGAMANAAGREANLNEHLLQQWAVVEVDDEIRRVGEVIINHLDPDGYLRVPLEEIAGKVRPPAALQTVTQTLKAVQKLDPVGVAARDLVECLLLQVDALPGDNRIERTLIRDHLDDITHNRLPQVAKATGFSMGEIQEAMRAMRSMVCLNPGFLVGDRSVPIIRPDVIVEYAETGNGLTVRLARGNLPKLCINDEVAAIAKTKGGEKETRDFARKQIEAASAIMDAVQFRQSRVLEVSKAIIERQRDFFDIGPEGLKVLRMNDLAQELGCDPSTISRTVAEKYMQTPRGIFPLRYFFTSGTETDAGESVGWDRVKQRVREIVNAEDKKDPLNDDQIAELLSRDGIVISRRTVAKYRGQLNIPMHRQRREF